MSLPSSQGQAGLEEPLLSHHSSAASLRKPASPHPGVLILQSRILRSCSQMRDLSRSKFCKHALTYPPPRCRSSRCPRTARPCVLWFCLLSCHTATGSGPPLDVPTLSCVSTVAPVRGSGAPAEWTGHGLWVHSPRNARVGASFGNCE